MRLIHSFINNVAVYVFLAAYEQRSTPALLNFVWNRVIEKQWATTSLDVAFAAIEYADAATLKFWKDQGWLDHAAYTKWLSQLQPETRKEQAMRIAVFITPEEIEAIHKGLRVLASVCDGAVQLDGAGFNGQDTQFGHELAARGTLTPLQAAHAKLMLRKYHGQLGDDLYGAIWPEDLAEEKRKAELKAQAKEQKAAEKQQRTDEKESAKQIKRTAGRGKVSDELAALLARLGTCDLSEYDEIEAQVRALRMTGGRVQVETPAPVTENQPQATQAQETATAQVDSHPAGTLTVENCTPENFAALTQCSELQINELMKHGGLSPELESSVRAAKAAGVDYPVTAQNSYVAEVAYKAPGESVVIKSAIPTAALMKMKASTMNDDLRAVAKRRGLAVCTGCDHYCVSGQHNCKGKDDAQPAATFTTYETASPVADIAAADKLRTDEQQPDTFDAQVKSEASNIIADMWQVMK
jgi:hypothetical protein